MNAITNKIKLDFRVSKASTLSFHRGLTFKISGMQNN